MEQVSYSIVAVSVARYRPGETISINAYAQPDELWLCPSSAGDDDTPYLEQINGHQYQFICEALRMEFRAVGEVGHDKYSATDWGDMADRIDEDDLEMIFNPYADELARLALLWLGEEGETGTFITLWRYAEEVDESEEYAGDQTWVLLGPLDMHAVANMVASQGQ